MSDTRFAILVACNPAEVIEARRPDVTHDEICEVVDEIIYMRDCYRNPSPTHRGLDFAKIFADLRTRVEAMLDYDALALL
jgi:hypothetical protein